MLGVERNLFLADVDVHEWTHVCQGFVVEDIVADILWQQQWCYRCKTRTRNAYRHTLHRKMTCSQLLFTARNDCSDCYLQQDSIPSSWLLATVSRHSITWHPHARTTYSRLRPADTYSACNLKMSTLFSCHYLRNHSALDIGVWGCIGIF